jgi:hypothetical protein
MPMTTDPVHMRVCAIAVNDPSLTIDERIRLRTEFMSVMSYEVLSDWAKQRYDLARTTYLRRTTATPLPIPVPPIVYP